MRKYFYVWKNCNSNYKSYKFNCVSSIIYICIIIRQLLNLKLSMNFQKRFYRLQTEQVNATTGERIVALKIVTMTMYTLRCLNKNPYAFRSQLKFQTFKVSRSLRAVVINKIRVSEPVQN